MKTVLITGIGGLTPRSITGIIRENHPDYHLIGIDVNKKALGFFMKGLLDEYYVCPRCMLLFVRQEKGYKQNAYSPLFFESTLPGLRQETRYRKRRCQ